MNVTVLPNAVVLEAIPEESLSRLLTRHGFLSDAPCGGKGTCGKCRVLVDDQWVLACQTSVNKDMTVTLHQAGQAVILEDSLRVSTVPDGNASHVLAFDIGTTTVVSYLLDGQNGTLLARASMLNPQAQFGADVISRIEHAMAGQAKTIQSLIRNALTTLATQVSSQAGISPRQIGGASIVGNTAMHHLLLGIDPKSLTVPPYMPTVSRGLSIPAEPILDIAPGAQIRLLPNIAGFVGGDTVGCLLATRFDQQTPLTLMIDIGTNGEMVLGNKDRAVACSTAAGPAFEGAKIQCGMRGETGAVDHVWLENGIVRYSVIGDGPALGLCGSGLLDLVAVLLETGDIDESGYMEDKHYTLSDSRVFLTQKDVREVQLAKAAIQAGIYLMTQHLGVEVSQIQQVFLAGAFGNYLAPKSACAIGMIPPVLLDRIQPIGNAAGEGAKLCALSQREFVYSQTLAEFTEFLELASLAEFNDCYVDCLCFGEEE